MANKPPHIPGLDSLRAAAVLAVMVGHAEYYFFGDAIALFTGGFIGVDLFFVLSGFLITRILLFERGESGRIALGRFYRNRALRLLPALFVLLICLFPVLWIWETHDQETLLMALATIVFYLYNWFVYFTLENLPGTGHLWSLSVEEQFYLLWPLLLILLGRSGGRAATRWVAICVAVFLLVAVVRAQGWEAGDSWLLLYLRTDLRVDALLAGAALAFLEQARALPRAGLRRFAVPLLLVFIVSTAVCDAEAPWMYLGGYSVLALLSAVLIASVVSGGLSGGWPVSNAIGRMSYGLYLYHMPVFVGFSSPLVAQLLPAPWLQMLLALCTTFMAAFVSYRLIEAPFLARKH